MKNLVILLLAYSLFACSSTQQSSDAVNYNGKVQGVLGYHSVQDALNTLTNSGSATVKTVRGWTIINDSSDKSIWSFAPESHPSYPSVVKRTIVERNGSIGIATEVSCGASKQQCDELVKDFMELNNKIRRDVNSEE